jgi:hypothetical protein
LVGKPFDGVIKDHPRMPRCLPNRSCRPGHQRVGERAKGDADVIRAKLRIPEHRGTAIGAKMKFDISPRVAPAHVDLARPLGAHLLPRKKGDDCKSRAGTPLALRAVTDADQRLSGCLHAQRPAAATGDPGHRKPSIFCVVASIRTALSARSDSVTRVFDIASYASRHFSVSLNAARYKVLVQILPRAPGRACDRNAGRRRDGIGCSLQRPVDDTKDIPTGA